MRVFRTLHFLPSSGGFDVHFFHKHDNATKLNRGLRQRFEVERVVLNPVDRIHRASWPAEQETDRIKLQK